MLKGNFEIEIMINNELIYLSAFDGVNVKRNGKGLVFNNPTIGILKRIDRKLK
ncbi:hypothetical protein [Mucilaginibacter terrae]|uniref:Uncharacterized protein n=1 Tax=Mucilaginibacter terrae TaxID=1955052 RepID=A0ABU3GVF9_9SPHI|nr:hypothetical protein [Mucilaginibacter terrae]MDT3403754.1 hypothetical protein [Mucilaginibacter terrae]